jgi:hypothetical protein
MPESGEYRVVIDFIRDEKSWLGVEAEFILIVN